MKINILVEEIDSKIAKKYLTRKITKCAKSAVKILKQKHNLLAINFTIMTENEIKKVNKQVRKKDEVTDVLSLPMLELKPGDKIKKKNFPNDYDAQNKYILLGDVLICYDIAKKQAGEFGHSIEREICYLAVHGVLHLLGFDHEEQGDKQIMRGVEEMVLNRNRLGR